MDIKLEQLLNKMSAEVAKAKEQAHHSSRVRDQLIAIKTLCELALAEEDTSSVRPTQTSAVVMPSQTQMQPPMQQQIIQSSTPNFEGTKLASDEANGDSLFDF